MVGKQYFCQGQIIQSVLVVFAGHIFFDALQYVEVTSEWKNSNWDQNHCAKMMTISKSNTVPILGISFTYSRHYRKCNICTFHEENNVTEVWILSVYTVLASEWTTKTGLYDLWIDLWHLKMASILFCPLQYVAQNKQHFLTLTWLVKFGQILTFYRPIFRRQTLRALELGRNKQDFL